MENQHTYSVSELNREVRMLLESHFLNVRVRGEISGMSRAQSGHCYFDLKDDRALLRCAWFRNHQSRLGLQPGNGGDGVAVIVTGELGLYEARGNYQLIVKNVEEVGTGALQRRFEQLRHKLQSEGLFESHRKQSPPPHPRTIGVITSPDGAVIHDILNTLKRRNPAITVIFYQSAVQGADAAPEIARCIERADTEGRCDALILSRGGGSPEDLWAFNEEVVARAIFHCRTPLITGIGHETDNTIADMAADLRAPTPTAAAELLSPERRLQLQALCAWQHRAGAALRATLNDAMRSRHDEQRRLHRLVRGVLHNAGQSVDLRHRSLYRPTQRLAHDRHRLATQHRALGLVARDRIRRRQLEAGQLQARLRQHTPLERLRHAQAARRAVHARLERSRETLRQLWRQNLDGLHKRLVALDPDAVLQRGYAIIKDGTDRHLIVDAATVEPGRTVHARLARGALWCTVQRSED